jgi:plastocyanin
MARSISTRPTLVLALAVLAAVAGILLAVRGPDAGAATAARTHTLHLSASKSALKFNKTRLTVRHGKVTVRMANPSSFPHGIAVEGHGVDKDGKIVSKGGTSKVTVTLKKGTYEFYCPVAGHKAAGMEGKLIVK